MKFTTRPTRSDVDLDEIAGDDGFLFVRNGVGFAAQGVACRGKFSAIKLAFTESEVDNHVGGPGTGPIAFGAIPFPGSTEAEFVIPKVVFGKREDGTRFVTTVDAFGPDYPKPDVRLVSARDYTLSSGRISPSAYKDAVARTTSEIAAGTFTKAVIARDIEIKASTPMSIHDVLARLGSSYGSSYRYSFDGLVGASPELLIEVIDGVVRSHPLAGTAPRTGDETEDRRLADTLLRSEKNQAEHKIVIDMVRETLLPHCSYLDWEPEPSIVQVANVQHLGSAAEGVLTRPHASVLQLAFELCPTPALGGYPRDAAIKWIREVEGFERGRYGGAVGWVDAHGNGTWAVTIRCAEFSSDRTTARLFAGCGIVADSDPESELAETQAKFQAMINAITGS